MKPCMTCPDATRQMVIYEIDGYEGEFQVSFIVQMRWIVVDIYLYFGMRESIGLDRNKGVRLNSPEIPELSLFLILHELEWN